MYIIKDKENKIIAISDTLAYQENGNPLIDNGMRAIAEILVGSVEESETIPEGWEYVDGIYNPIVEEVPTTEDRIEALESENTLLKAQVSALADNQEFLEDCLIEVGQVVYA